MIGSSNAVRVCAGADNSYLVRGINPINTNHYGTAIYGSGVYERLPCVHGDCYGATQWFYFEDAIDVSDKSLLKFKARITARNPTSANDRLYIGLLSAPLVTTATVPTFDAGISLVDVSTEYIEHTVDISELTGEKYFEAYFFGVVADVTDIQLI